MFDYVKPILKRKGNYIVFYVGTNNAKGMTSRNILDKRLQMKTAVLDSDENYKGILSQPMTGVDDGKAGFTISNRSSHQRCSVKKGALEISQNSQKNTCARVAFLIKLQAPPVFL